MKKIMCTIAVLSACALLAACGGGSEVNEKTDPNTLATDKVAEKQWAEAFAAQNNYCVRTTVTNTSTAKDATMSEVTTIDYCNDGERVHVLMSLKEGENTLFEAESYADLAEKKAIWSRSKEDGKWMEWDSETYTSEQFAEFFEGFQIPAFARDRFAQFSYSESEKGYTMSAGELPKSAVSDYIASALSNTDVGGEDLEAEKFILKFKGGKPAACLFEAAQRQESGQTAYEDPMGKALFWRSLLPEIHFSRHGHIPRILIEIRPLPRETESVPDAPEEPAGRVSCSQLFYNYGKVRVTLPEELPPIEEE